MSEPVHIWVPEYHAPGNNGRGGLRRMHRWAYAKARKRAVEHLLVAGAIRHQFGTAEVRCRYTRKRRSGPEMDDDNLASSFKLIGDALETLEVVDDDKQIRLDAHQELVGRKGDWGTELILSAG